MCWLRGCPLGFIFINSNYLTSRLHWIVKFTLMETRMHTHSAYCESSSRETSRITRSLLRLLLYDVDNRVNSCPDIQVVLEITCRDLYKTYFVIHETI